MKIKLIGLLTVTIIITSYTFRKNVVTVMGGILHDKNGTTYFDIRDSITYKIVDINDQYWFVDDLKYGTIDSLNIVAKANIEGCFYSKESALKSCPKGWRLPNIKDWKNALGYIESENNYKKNKIKVNENRNKLQYNGRKGTNLFSNFNPLDLRRTGRIDHGELISFGLVDYWVEDYQNLLTHAHIGSRHVTIHNHEKGLVENELPVRLFKVKCVCDRNQTN